MRCRAASLAGMLVALVLAGGCTQESDDWATSAVKWIESYDEAVNEREMLHSLYYAPDAVLDLAMLAGRKNVFENRTAILPMLRVEFAAEIERGPLFLGTNGVVRSLVFDWGDPEAPPEAALRYLHIGSDGIEENVSLAPVWFTRTLAHGQADAFAGAERIAAEYLQAWNSAEPAAVAALYAPDARLEGSLTQAPVQGRDDIAALAGAGAIQAVTVGEAFPDIVVPDGDGPTAETPAVFVYLDFAVQPELAQVWLMVHSDGACPGESIVALELDEQSRVTSEHRFGSLSSLRACTEPAQPPSGWWDGRAPPMSFSERVTGTLDSAAGGVEIRNGSESTDALVRWAYGQFLSAGLPPPSVSSIAFDPLHQRCEFMPGYADWSDGTTDILVCFDSAGVAVPTGEGTADLPHQSHLVLHELSHAWLRANVDTAQQAELIALVRATSWNDKDDLWRERGVEWAAESLAWGLKGTAGTSVPLASPDCELLAEGFRILTGIEPPTQYS